MTAPHVYDKAKYHLETTAEYGLPDSQAANHTAYFLRWLVEHDMMSSKFLAETEVLGRYRKGDASIHEVYAWWDNSLIEEMLSDEGNRFALHYFDFDRGSYIKDYVTTLIGSLPSEFHIPYTEESYRRLERVIDRRYREWKSPRKGWWPF